MEHDVPYSNTSTLRRLRQNRTDLFEPLRVCVVAMYLPAHWESIKLSKQDRKQTLGAFSGQSLDIKHPHGVLAEFFEGGSHVLDVLTIYLPGNFAIMASWLEPVTLEQGSTQRLARNNTSMQNVPNQGPIPAGQYQIIGNSYNHPKKGPISMNLTPVGHNALGRSGFMIHGNNLQNDASQGCIILGPTIRQQISSSGDTLLVVQP